jgi:O-antigen/teichoic acid export membrane protein
MDPIAKESAPANVTRNALLSALAQSAVMIAGGINAVVIGARYPVSTETDSLFTAFALYSIWVVIATSARTALVPRLFDREQPFRAFNAVLASLVWVLPIIVFALLAIGIPIVNALSVGDSTIGAEALLIFCAAAPLQLVVAVTAAMFAVLNDFISPAKAFGVGGLVNIVAFLLIEPALGLVALPIAALISSFVTALLILLALRRAGWRPSELHFVSAREALPWLTTVGLGSAFYVGSQALYLISMIFAAGSLAAGSATVYTYAYMAIGLVIALSASAGGMALAAPVAASWTGDATHVEPVEDDVTKSMTVVMVLVAGVIASCGAAIAAPLLPGFTTPDINALVESATILCGLALASSVTIVPLAAMFAARRYGWIAVIALAGIPALAVFTAVLLELNDSLASIAVAAVIANFLLAWGILWLCHRATTPRRIAVQLWQIALVAIPGAIAYYVADRLLIGSDGASSVVHFATALVGSAILGLYVALVLPSYRTLFLRMLTQSVGGAQRQ